LKKSYKTTKIALAHIIPFLKKNINKKMVLADETPKQILIKLIKQRKDKNLFPK
jgi:hypothetical protein